MGIAAGFSGTFTGVLTASLPVLFGVVTQGLPTAYQIVGFLLALVGLWLVSRRENEVGGARDLGLAVLAGLGFGGFLILLAQAGTSAVFWPVVTARGTGLSLLLLILLADRKKLRGEKGGPLLMSLTGMHVVPLTMGFGFPPVFGGSLGLAFSALPKVWTALGGAGIGLGMLFYALFIPAALPMNLAYFELCVATFADKFGMPRTKTVTITVIGVALLAILFSLPIYDALNGESFGFTMLFTAWYWQILILGLASIFKSQPSRKFQSSSKVVQSSQWNLHNSTPTQSIW